MPFLYYFAEVAILYLDKDVVGKELSIWRLVIEAAVFFFENSVVSVWLYVHGCGACFIANNVQRKSVIQVLVQCISEPVQIMQNIITSSTESQACVPKNERKRDEVCLFTLKK